MDNKGQYECELDQKSPNRNLAPITTEIDQNGRLVVGGCQLSSIAKRYGTPLYVLDEESVRVSCKSYLEALRTHYKGESLPLYASKANSSIAMTKLVASEGFGIDVVSAGELLTALRGGVSGERIFLHGNNKSDQELLIAYEADATVVIDNHHDLERLKELVSKRTKPVRLMLRFTPGIECHTHEYIKTGHLDSKFGFDPDQLDALFKELIDYPWAILTGIHAHIGSQIFELEPHQDLAEVITETFCLAKKYGHPVQDMNIGGGLGVRYVVSDDPPSIQDWIRVISTAVTKACKIRGLQLPRLMCEPGRSLVATAGLTLYTLGAKKSIPGLRTYISVDGGMSDNPRPITYQSLYTCCLADRPLDETDEIVTIAGKHCESGDILLKDIGLPKPLSGDILVVFSTGAYNNSMSSNYNRIPRPAGVIVNAGHAELIQKRERPEDLLMYDVLPERL